MEESSSKYKTKSVSSWKNVSSSAGHCAPYVLLLTIRNTSNRFRERYEKYMMKVMSSIKSLIKRKKRNLSEIIMRLLRTIESNTAMRFSTVCDNTGDYRQESNGKLLTATTRDFVFESD